MADPESSQIKEAPHEEPMIEHLDVSYGTDERHKIDFYQSAGASSMSPPPPLLVFIHGGAWRTGSRKDHADMARRLVNLCGGNLTVALVDYRLTTQKPLSPSWSRASKEPVQYDNRHPAHLEDVFAALRFLLLPAKGDGEDDEGGGDKGNGEIKSPPSKKTKREGDDTKKQSHLATRYSYDSDKVVIMGHSVGAWMAAATMLNPQSTSGTGPAVIPPLCGNEEDLKLLTSKIWLWVLVDGIYLLPSLLDEYPSYRDFVAQAFPLDEPTHGTEAEQLQQASITAWPPRSFDYYRKGQCPSILFMHSSDDELLSLRQTREADRYLAVQLMDEKGESDTAFSYPAWGGHDAILTNEDFLETLASEISEHYLKPRDLDRGEEEEEEEAPSEEE